MTMFRRRFFYNQSHEIFLIFFLIWNFYENISFIQCNDNNVVTTTIENHFTIQESTTEIIEATTNPVTIETTLPDERTIKTESTQEETTKLSTTTEIYVETTNNQISSIYSTDSETEISAATTTLKITLPTDSTTPFEPSEENCRKQVEIKTFRITDHTSTSLQVEWEISANYENCVENVNITWIDEDNHEISEHFIFESQVKLFNITNLQPCRMYTIEMKLMGPKEEFIVDQKTIKEKTDSIVPKAVDLQCNSNVNSIELLWKLTNENDKYCITGYKITYYQIENSGDPKSIESGTTMTYTIEHLRPCTKYNIEIMAIGIENKMGDKTSKETRTLSEAPTTVQLILTSNQKTINATWNYESQNGMECLIGYQISYKLHSDENYLIVDKIIAKTENTYLLENLKYCNEYDVEILPIGEKENGSVAKESIKTDFTAPSKVRNLRLSKDKDNIRVTWDIPDIAPECVTEYQISCRLKGSDVDLEPIIHNSTESPDIFKGLNYCSNYEIEIIPLGQEGLDGEKDSDSIHTESTDVDEVRNLRHTVSHNKIIVEWEPPTNFACVEEYIITCVAEKINFQHENITKHLSIVYSNLEPCIAYNITVQPIAKDDKQSKSRCIVSETSKSKPSKITDLKIEPLEYALNISWSPPKANKYCVKQYSVQIDNNQPELTETESKVMRKLNACTSYSVTIVPIVSDIMQGDPTINNGETLSSVTDAPNLINIMIDKKYAILNYTLNIENNRCELKSATTICESKKSPPIVIDTELKNIATIAGHNINFQVNVTNLSAFTEYMCQTSVKNIQGSSEENITNIKTMADAPSEPILRQPTEISTNSFTINWENPKSIPGDDYSETLIISEIGPHFFIPTDCVAPGTKERETIKLNNGKKSYHYTNALPYTLYVIQIFGSTEGGNGPVAKQNVLTNPSASAPVRELDVHINYVEDKNISYPYNIQLTWKSPCNTSGVLHAFSLERNGTSLPIYIPAENKSSYEMYLEDLKPENNYIVNVYALTQTSGNPIQSLGASCAVQTPAGVPNFTTNYKNITVDPYKTNNPEHKAELKFSENIFSTEMGMIKYYSIIISKVGFKECSKFESWNDTDDNWVSDIKKWPHYPYQATKIRWNPFKNGIYDYVYVIGNENCQDDDYCNAPLNPNTNYSVCIRGFTSKGYCDTPPIYFQTAVAFNAGVIIAVIISLFIFGTCLSFAIYFKNGNASVWVKSIFLCKDISTNTSQNTVMPPRISIQNFPAHCTMLRTNANQLSSEFSLLETLSDDIALLTYTGDLPHNRVKNRYPNIKPYDVTRVKLRVVPDEFSDYINASYIKGYSSDVEYIATQGPKEETVDDFWQMVYENDVKQIVMVTNLTEKGKNKCYKYYPEELDPITCNNGIELECEFVDFKQAFTIRHISLKKKTHPYIIERKLIHLQFHEWPDFGVPQSTDSVLKLSREIRSHQAHNYGVVVVHCSAGVGRTGTIITIDILVQAIHANRKIDVFGTVLNLRKQRQHMVKNEGQYAFIYSCLRDEILNPRVFQGTDRHSSYTSFNERGYYNFYDDGDLRKLSIESAM